MDSKMGNPSDKRSCWSSAVQWCFYVFIVATCGYSLVRQQRLEQRLRVLEQQHFQLEETVYSFHQPQEEVLTRKARDVTDCICPSEISLRRKWKGLRGCFTRELRRQENVQAGIDPGARKSEYTHFKQMLFLINVVNPKPSSSRNKEYLHFEEPSISAVKQENLSHEDFSQLEDENSEDNSKLDEASSEYSKLEEVNVEFDNRDPLRDIKRLKLKKAKYESVTEDEDLLFLLSMLKTLQRVPFKKKMATRMKLMAVLDEATRDLED